MATLSFDDNNYASGTKLLEVKAHSFVTDAGELLFDYGCICLGLKAYAPLLEEMRSIAKTIAVGDARLAPRLIIDGTREARQVINTIESMGYLG